MGSASIDQKIYILAKNFLDMEKEFGKVQSTLKQKEKQSELIQREKEHLQKEYNKGVLIRYIILIKNEKIIIPNFPFICLSSSSSFRITLCYSGARNKSQIESHFYSQKHSSAVIISFVLFSFKLFENQNVYVSSIVCFNFIRI